MSIFTPDQAALQAVPSPVRTAAVPAHEQDDFATAYDACKAHPAYRDIVVIRNSLVALRDLCEQFTEKYHPDTILVYLRNEGFRTSDLSEDFEHVHRDVLGAVWILDVIRAGIEPSLVLPFDLGTTPTSTATRAKGGAA